MQTILALLTLSYYYSLLSNATSSIIAKNCAESDDLYKHFPKFLWLVRDAALRYNGTPTDYIRNEVLVRSSRATPDRLDCIVRAIVTLFPSIECHMLPRPSTDPEILEDMISNESHLNPDFIKQLEDVYEFLRSCIRPKGIDNHIAVTAFSGLVLAELLEQYVLAVNADQDIVLQTCWQSAFQSALHSYSNQLVDKYQQQMKASLQGKLPLEEGDTRTHCEHKGTTTLMQFHDCIASSLYDDLRREIQLLLGSNHNKDIAANIEADFQMRIAVYDVENHQVESGELLRFVNENYDESAKLCQSIFDQSYSTIHEQVIAAHRDKKQLYIDDEIKTIKTEYGRKAIGPAKEEVLKLGLIKLQTDCDTLANIPGPPAHLKATKIAKDHIVIRWNGAAFNTPKITHFTAECAEAESVDLEWKSMVVDKQTATANELKAHTKYLFRVHAYINEYKSQESTISVTTKLSSTVRGAAAVGAFVGGALISPVAAVAINPALAPAMTVVGLFGAPITGGYLAKKVYQKSGEEEIPYPWRPL